MNIQYSKDKHPGLEWTCSKGMKHGVAQQNLAAMYFGTVTPRSNVAMSLQPCSTFDSWRHAAQILAAMYRSKIALIILAGL